MKKIINIIGLFRTLFFSSALILSLGQAQAAYNDAGTDYTTASSGSWIEDASKQALNMVNAFVCIIKNSNGDSRPNGTWRILIDEVACDLNEDDSVAWADQIAVSTRASNDSDQEVISYFNTADGNKYVVNTTLNESATSAYGLTMLFKWYNAYSSYGGSDLTSSGWVDGVDNDYGFSEIIVEDYDSDGTDDTVIRTAETYGGSATFGGIVVNYGGSPAGASTAFLVSAPDYSSGDSGSVTYAGALNDTEYLRQTYDSDSGTFGGDVCYSNDDPFQTVYRYGVYDSDTGEELTISGSFGFTYEEGASGESGRGFMGHWGTWFDNRDDKLSATNTSQAITRESDSASLTLKWSPGKMWQKDSSEVALSASEKFEVYDWTNGERYNIVWDTNKFNFANDLDFDDDGVNDVTGGLEGDTFTFDAANGGTTQISEGNWFYSERFDTWVGYLGQNDSGVYQIYVEENSQVKGHWTGATGQGIGVNNGRVTFVCASDCPNAAITPSSYSSYSYTSTSNVGDTYILTGFNESEAGIYPLSLYKDTVAAANLVSFDLSDGNDWSNDTHAHIWSGNFIPQDDINGTCAANSDPNAAANIYNCDSRYVWESGLREWGQGVVLVDSANAAVTIEDPIAFNYTHAAANDRNNTAYPISSTPFNYTWIETDWNTSPPSSTSSADEMFVAAVDGLTMNLSYEGAGELWGFPERQTPNGWMKLVNLKDGTEITRKSDSSTYVVKALDTGLLLNTQACSGDLSVPAAFTDLDIIPSPSDKTKPTQIFNSAPTVTAIHVKQGEDLIDPSLVQANE